MLYFLNILYRHLKQKAHHRLYRYLAKIGYLLYKLVGRSPTNAALWARLEAIMLQILPIILFSNSQAVAYYSQWFSPLFS